MSGMVPFRRTLNIAMNEERNLEKLLSQFGSKDRRHPYPFRHLADRCESSHSYISG